MEALRERYPRALADVPSEWWRAADVAEQLGAVSAWRLDLDSGRSANPREELDFHEALERLRERLEGRLCSALLESTARGALEDPEDTSVCQLDDDLRALADSSDVSLEEAFFAPNDARPGCRSHRPRRPG